MGRRLRLLWLQCFTGQAELPRLLAGIGKSNLPFKNCIRHIQNWVSMEEVAINCDLGKGT